MGAGHSPIRPEVGPFRPDVQKAGGSQARQLPAASVTTHGVETCPLSSPVHLCSVSWHLVDFYRPWIIHRVEAMMLL